MKTMLMIFSFLIVVLLVVSCERESQPANGERTPEAPARTVPKCPFLTPVMVQETCNLDPSVVLISAGESQNNCGDIITTQVHDPVAALQVDDYYANREQYSSQPDQLGDPLAMWNRFYSLIGQGDREFKLIEGVGDQAFVTTLNKNQKLADIGISDGFLLYFSSQQKQISGVLKVAQYIHIKPVFAEIEGCSVEEAKRLVRMVLERLPD